MATGDDIVRCGHEKDFSHKTRARNFCVENRVWLGKTSNQSMARAGCPMAHTCGEELCQELIINSGQVRDDIWSRVEDPKSYYFKIAGREGGKLKTECGCGDAVGTADENELDDLVAAARPAEVWQIAARMDDLIEFREVVERYLSTEEQAILILRAEGRGGPEIARLLGISHAALRQRKSRLMRKLRKLFPEKGGE